MNAFMAASTGPESSLTMAPRPKGSSSAALRAPSMSPRKMAAKICTSLIATFVAAMAVARRRPVSAISMPLKPPERNPRLPSPRTDASVPLVSAWPLFSATHCFRRARDASRRRCIGVSSAVIST